MLLRPLAFCHRVVCSAKQNSLHKDSEAAFTALAAILLKSEKALLGILLKSKHEKQRTCLFYRSALSPPFSGSLGIVSLLFLLEWLNITRVKPTRPRLQAT